MGRVIIGVVIIAVLVLSGYFLKLDFRVKDLYCRVTGGYPKLSFDSKTIDCLSQSEEDLIIK